MEGIEPAPVRVVTKDGSREPPTLDNVKRARQRETFTFCEF